MSVTSRGRVGFTLMELLAAVTLMVILGTMLFTVFDNSSGVVREASGRQVVFQQAKLLMEHMERELSGTYMDKGHHLRPFLVTADGHAVAMTTAARVRDTRQDSINYGREGNMGRIGYFLGDGSGGFERHILYRFEYYTLDGSGDDPSEVARAEPFIRNVVAFNVEVFDNGSFRIMGWNSNAAKALPRAVRITLQLTDDRHLAEYDGVDDNGDGVVDDFNETNDTVGQTFQHVAYLGDRS